MNALFRNTFTAFRSAMLLGFALLATSCMLVENPLQSPETADPGYVKFRLKLQQSRPALLSKMSADTTFSLDSLIIVLSAPNAPTQRYAYAVSGRADTGNVRVPSMVFGLASLRNWKAYFYSIDLRENPLGRDTVHIDSVAFAVLPADTARVLKTISPAFSILRARFISRAADSVANNVLWLRLKVDGVVRDSVLIGGSDASLNWLQAASGSTIHAGDSGKVLRSTNNGASWSETRLAGSPNLVAGAAPTANRVYVISRTGVLRWSEDGGQTWPAWQENSGTTPYAVNALTFTSESVGWTVGNNGGVYKYFSPNDRQVTTSNTSQHLNGVHFPSASVGYVVGENETILKTTDGNAAQANQIVWAPVAGGWFTQTSGTTVDVRDVKFTSATRGWVMGPDYIRLTTNGGATWDARGGLNVSSPRAFWFTGAGTSAGQAWAVGDGGQMSQYDGEYFWHARASGTSENLYDVCFVGSDTGWAVGAGGTIRRTVMGGNTGFWPPNTQWTAQTSNTSNTLRSVYPVNSSVVYVAGDGGVILKTTNAGGLWSMQSNSGQNLNAIAFAGASVGWAVGNNGAIRKTVNGGASWVSQSSGTTQHLRSVHAVSADTAYAAGAAGVLLKTVDGGVTWYKQETPNTQTLNRVFFYNADIAFSAGGGGTILKAVNRGDNWTGGGIKRSLKGVYFTDVNTGWIVGADGVILKTTNGGNSWTQQASGTSVMLYGVHFRSASVGWVTGEGGVILKTTNGGATWVPQTSNTSITLRWASFRDENTGFVIGGTQSMLSTSNGGGAWISKFVGIAGAKTFDQTLTYKYLKPRQSHTVVMQAIDRESALRGYQLSVTFTAGAGQDSSFIVPMVRCGFGVPTPACTP